MLQFLRELFTVRDLLDFFFAAAVLLALGGIAWVVWRRKLKPDRFPLKPNKQRHSLQLFILDHERKNPKVTLEHVRIYLDKVKTRNSKLTLTPYDDHLIAQTVNHKPVRIGLKDGLYHADFGKSDAPDGEMYQSPLALVWHVCNWTLTYEDEQRFYRHVREAKLFEIRKNMIYFHVNMNDYSSFQKRDGVWQYFPDGPRVKVNAP